MYVVLESDQARGQWLKEFMALKPTKDNPIRVTVERGQPPKKRTLSQNDLLHLWFHEIATFTGHSADETKEFLKDMFIKPKVVEVAGKSRLIRPGTSALSKEEMSVFLDRVEAWASTDLGLQLPRRETE